MPSTNFQTLLAAAIVLLGTQAPAATLTTFATFDGSKLEIPENIVFDRSGNAYVSLILSNEVRKIAPDGAQSTYATFNGAFGSLTAGLVIDDETGDLYVAYDPVGQPSVVYRVRPDRTTLVYSTFPTGAGLNGLTPDDDGNLYVADSFLGYVWRVPAGGGAPSIWIDLHAPGSMQLPGPNGIKLDKHGRNVYVSVPNRGTLYRIPLLDNGQPGAPEPFVTNFTPDDFAFDKAGNLYVATEPAKSVVRIRPDGTMDTIASSADGLGNTTAVAFGRVGADKLELYILSSSLPPGPSAPPGVFKLHLDIPGLPVSIH